MLLKSFVLLWARAVPWLHHFFANFGAVCTFCNRGKPGDSFFFCSPRGGGGQAPGPLLRCFGRGIRNCLGSGCRIRFKLDSGMELFILFCPLDGAGAWEPGGAACFALGTGTALDKIRLPRKGTTFCIWCSP